MRSGTQFTPSLECVLRFCVTETKTLVERNDGALVFIYFPNSVRENMWNSCGSRVRALVFWRALQVLIRTASHWWRKETALTGTKWRPEQNKTEVGTKFDKNFLSIDVPWKEVKLSSQLFLLVENNLCTQLRFNLFCKHKKWSNALLFHMKFDHAA